MRVAELFAGSRSIARACAKINARARRAGQPPRFEVWSTDWEAFKGIDHVGDVLAIKALDQFIAADFTWASVPCTSYSLLAIGHHRNGPEPKTDAARLGDRIVVHTLDLIRRNGGGFMVENPRAMLRKMPFMRGIDRRTVTYCSYGDARMKPTDLWSNVFRSMFLPEGFQVAPMCYNSNKHCHHDRSPRATTLKARGEKRTGGTAFLGSAYDRSILPEGLCLAIMSNVWELWDQRLGPWASSDV